MQINTFVAGALLSIAATVSANNIATLSANPSQASVIESDLSSYFANLVAQPAFTSVLSVMATGLPAEVFDAFTADPSDFFAMLATETALPTAFQAVPTDVQNYLKSVGAAEVSIVDKDLGVSNAQPTNVAMKAAGAVMAAGAIAVAML